MRLVPDHPELLPFQVLPFRKENAVPTPPEEEEEMLPFTVPLRRTLRIHV